MSEAADEDGFGASPPNYPSIPILSCRWGLGEGVSAASLFEPIPIPPYLLSGQPLGPPEPRRPARGRGRAAALGVHSELNDVGEMDSPVTNRPITSLPISEQISRANLPTGAGATDFEQFLLPAREDETAAPRPSPRKPHSSGIAGGVPLSGGDTPSWAGQRDWTGSFDRLQHWTGLLDPRGAVAAVDSALARPPPIDGGGDVPAAGRTYADNDSEPDCLEEVCTSSSDSDRGPFAPRRWRPRPPAIASNEAFPPLPSAAAAAPGSKPGPANPSASTRVYGGPRSTPYDHGGPRSTTSDHGGPRSTTSDHGGPRSTTCDRGVPHSTTSEYNGSRAAISNLGGLRSNASDHGSSAGSGRPPFSSGERRAASGMLLATGVTDDNWPDVQDWVSAYGELASSRRHGHTGYLTLREAWKVDWLLGAPDDDCSPRCDIPGVELSRADDILDVELSRAQLSQPD